MTTMSLRMGRFLFGFLLIAGTTWPQAGSSSDGTTMILATSETSQAVVWTADGHVQEERPGWFVELSRRAAEQCDAKVEFAFMPWPRALEKVKLGKVSAAFNSSYKPERAEYGVYPRKGGELDEDRASRRYAYYAYVSKTSTDSALLEIADVNGRLIVTERKASIIPELEKRGAELVEAVDFRLMLRIVVGGRVDAAVGIDHDFDAVLEDNPDLAAAVMRVKKPILKKTGYVMFSKLFYQKHSEVVECFWSTSAQLRKTEWFKTLRAAY